MCVPKTEDHIAEVFVTFNNIYSITDHVHTFHNVFSTPKTCIGDGELNYFQTIRFIIASWASSLRPAIAQMNT